MTALEYNLITNGSQTPYRNFVTFCRDLLVRDYWMYTDIRDINRNKNQYQLTFTELHIKRHEARKIIQVLDKHFGSEYPNSTKLTLEGTICKTTPVHSAFLSAILLFFKHPNLLDGVKEDTDKETLFRILISNYKVLNIELSSTDFIYTLAYLELLKELYKVFPRNNCVGPAEYTETKSSRTEIGALVYSFVKKYKDEFRNLLLNSRGEIFLGSSYSLAMYAVYSEELKIYPEWHGTGFWKRTVRKKKELYETILKGEKKNG